MRGAEATRRAITFQRTVLNFYRTQGRVFPWRRTRSPYAITVSELMLQQTQTSRVAEYYPRFIQRFPSFRALSRAPLRAVLKEWQGLGYNRRAKFLWELSRLVSHKHGGRLPSSEQDLRALPGIGTYTAAALQVFVFGQAVPMIETNIRTAYLHHFFPRRRSVTDPELLAIIERTLWKRNPRTWFYALMDFGAFLKKSAPAAHRRSAHYKRQDRFKGSSRQARGMVMRTILAHGPLTVTALTQATGLPRSRLQKSVEALIEEGLLRTVGAKPRELKVDAA